MTGLTPDSLRWKSTNILQSGREQLHQALSSLDPEHGHRRSSIRRRRAVDIKRSQRVLECYDNLEFGFHPDQLFTPAFMPDDGLTDSPAAMYGIALRLLDLCDLKKRGCLAMEPVDFLRWRIGEILMTKPNALRVICQTIQKNDETYGDPIMRFVMRHVDDVAQNREATRRARFATGSSGYRVNKRNSKLSKLRTSPLRAPLSTDPLAFRLQRAKDKEEKDALRTQYINRPINTNLDKRSTVILSPKQSIDFQRRVGFFSNRAIAKRLF